MLLSNLTNHVLIRLTFRPHKCLRLKYPESLYNLSSRPRRHYCHHCAQQILRQSFSALVHCTVSDSFELLILISNISQKYSNKGQICAKYRSKWCQLQAKCVSNIDHIDVKYRSKVSEYRSNWCQIQVKLMSKIGPIGVLCQMRVNLVPNIGSN